MGFVRRGGGGGSGDEDGGGDEEQGVAIKRCELCRRELLPWQDTCPDDGGRAVHPGEIQPEHDALLARLLAEEDETHEDDEAPDEGAPGGGDGPHDTTDDAASWPRGDRADEA